MECMIAQYVKKILVCQLFQVFGSCRGRQQDRAYPQRLFLGRGNDTISDGKRTDLTVHQISEWRMEDPSGGRTDEGRI